MGIVVTFGEVMGRFCPREHLRLLQTLPGELEVTFGGAESNVAASIVLFGGQARYITALPSNDLGDAVINTVRGLGVDTSFIVRTNHGRLGLYFVEHGANQRPSNVIYDRKGSAISVTSADAYAWDTIYDGASWFHTTGITPAISKTSAEATLVAVKKAKAAGLTVSCDLNFRNKLWCWEPGTEQRELAERTMRGILPYVDIVIANEGDCSDVLSINAPGTDVESGEICVSRYPEVGRCICQQFDNVKKVAITLRESVSASYNKWGAMLYDRTMDQAVFAPMHENEYRPYEIHNIVDRVGGGDSFGAALIYALNGSEFSEPEVALKFAVAASCLAHSIKGDINFNTRPEVEKLMNGSGSGRVVR